MPLRRLPPGRSPGRLAWNGGVSGLSGLPVRCRHQAMRRLLRRRKRRCARL